MLLLYKMDGCPYCKKVLDYLQGTSIEYKAVDISDKVSNDELMRLGGKEQVPFLYDTERQTGIYESDHIIEYLQTV